MKKQWERPNLDILDVSMTMWGLGKPGKEDPNGPPPEEGILDS